MNEIDTLSLFTLRAMKYTLRDYQKQASDAAVKSFLSSKKSNGIIIVSTGGGKSLIIADIASRLNSPLIVLSLQRNYCNRTLKNYRVMEYLIVLAILLLLVARISIELPLPQLEA